MIVGDSVPLDGRYCESPGLGRKRLICAASLMALSLPLSGLGSGVAVVEVP
jgi:hypothetical protein